MKNQITYAIRYNGDDTPEKSYRDALAAAIDEDYLVVEDI